jgi:hypothetical protein
VVFGPFQLSSLFLQRDGLLEFVVVDRLEGSSIVETGVFCNLDLFDESGVYFFSKHFAVVFGQGVVEPVNFALFFHFYFGTIYKKNCEDNLSVVCQKTKFLPFAIPRVVRVDNTIMVGKITIDISSS